MAPAAVPCTSSALSRSTLRHARSGPQRSVFAARASASTKDLPERVLPLMSDYLEAQAAVNVFERLAGRTAMIGFGVAAAAELALPGPNTGLFGALAQNGTAAGELAAAGTFLLCCSVGLAARTYRPTARRHGLLEPLLCSLTSGRRSFAGVTQRNVDRGVDHLLDSVFSQPFISANFMEEDKYI